MGYMLIPFFKCCFAGGPIKPLNFMLAEMHIFGKATCVHYLFIDIMRYYTIIDFNEVDMRIYLPEKVIINRGR